MTRLCPKCGEHKKPRPGGRICVDCRNAYRLQWYYANKSDQREYAKGQYDKHKHKYVHARKAWGEKNRQKRVAYSRNWQRRNAEDHRAYNGMWSSGKRAYVKQATPKWANKFFMKEAYRLAALRTKTTGYAWHVDHIVPLISPLVCGFHVEHNLRVIPAIENLRKSNKMEI